MIRALELKFLVQGLTEADAAPLIYDYVLGEEWRSGHQFFDGSYADIKFKDDGKGQSRCQVTCFIDGARLKPVVRAKFTCDFLPKGVCVEGYYDGWIVAGDPVPYFSFDDVVAMQRVLCDVRVSARKIPSNGSLRQDVFDILLPGYEWGEQAPSEAFLLDLDDRVVEAYCLGWREWNWKPYHGVQLAKGS